MSNPRNIAVVTIAWSDNYAGGQLAGRRGDEGHERYNFLPSGGNFYGYFPPNGNSFPKAKGKSVWLIFYVSRPTRDAPSVVVGWYEDASIVGSAPRPDTDRLELNSEDDPFTYSATTNRAVCIPVAARDCVLPKGDSLRSYAFVRTDGTDKKTRASLIKLLLGYHRSIKRAGANTPPTGGGGFPVDPKLRKQIENAAVEAVKADYRKGFHFEDKQALLGTGYDLKFTDRKSGEMWCIEVKGTAGARDAFFITRTERKVGRDFLADERAGGLGKWRLALVTCALDPERRNIEYLDAEALDDRFDFECLQWQAVSKNEEVA